MRRSWGLDAAGGTFRDYVKRRGWDRRLKEATVHVIWEDVVGERNAEHTETILCHDGRLLVTTDTPPWAHELTMLRHQIAQKLNDALGEGIIRDIQFQPKGLTGEARGTPPVRRSELKFAGGMKVSEGELAGIPLPQDVLADIERTVGSLEHDELRERVRETLLRERRISQWKRDHGYRPCARCGALHNDPAALCNTCAIPEIYGGGPSASERGLEAESPDAQDWETLEP